MEEIMKLEQFFYENKDIFDADKYEKSMSILSELKNAIEKKTENPAEE
jgi:hypothetical protein